MPRYYFQLRDDIDAKDEEGAELPDIASARAQAETYARTMACQEVLEGHLNLHHRIEVEDEAGQRVAIVTFGEVVKLEI